MTDRARTEAPPRFAVDDRELDEAFSAWDEDDALARRPPTGASHAQGTSSTVERTRVARKPLAAATPGGTPPPARTPPGTAPPATERDAPRGAHGPAATAAAAAAALEPDAARDPWRRLVDPVSMHDIVLSRARTLDDPLTTRVLAEITRAEALSERAHRPAGAPPAPAPPPALDLISTDEISTDEIVTDPDSDPGAEDPRAALLGEDLDRPRGRTTRRTIPRLRDEPFRKK